MNIYICHSWTFTWVPETYVIVATKQESNEHKTMFTTRNQNLWIYGERGMEKRWKSMSGYSLPLPFITELELCDSITGGYLFNSWFHPTGYFLSLLSFCNTCQLSPFPFFLPWKKYNECIQNYWYWKKIKCVVVFSYCFFSADRCVVEGNYNWFSQESYYLEKWKE